MCNRQGVTHYVCGAVLGCSIHLVKLPYGKVLEDSKSGLSSDYDSILYLFFVHRSMSKNKHHSCFNSVIFNSLIPFNTQECK